MSDLSRRLGFGFMVVALATIGSCRESERDESTTSGSSPIVDLGEISIPSPNPQPTETRVQEAVREARNAVASNPSSARSWGKLGAVLDAHGYFEEAARCYREALELSLDSFVWNYHLAVTLDREAGDLEEVIALFSRAAELEPSYPPTYYRLGVVHFKAGRYGQARRYLEKAISLDPELAITRRQLGQGVLAAGEGDLAS